MSQPSKGANYRILFVAILTCLVATSTWKEVRAADCLVPSFQPARNFAVGIFPGRPAVDDFNHDGKPDMAVTSPDSSFVAVFLGDGTGNFASPSHLAAGSFSVPVATGDFNQDGNADLAVGSRQGTIWIYYGNGAGGFTGPAIFRDTNSGGEAYDIVVMDFNHDGKVDLAIGHQFAALSILLGNGTGGFSSPIDYIIGLGPVELAAADFNNDGETDLVTSNAQGHNVSILLGNGTGGFTVTSLPAAPGATAVGDFNGDSNIDLIVGNPDPNSVSLLLGSGTGSFGSPITIFTAAGGRVRSADFNGDGKLDFAESSFGGTTVAILLGDGSGGFSPPSHFVVGRGSVGIAVADLNSDGKPDIITATYYSLSASVLINNGLQVDLDPPTITSAPDITVDATDPAGAAVVYSVTAGDNSGLSPSLSCNIPSGGTFPIGTTQVTCTAVDSCGNTSSTSTSFNITVIDQPPILSLPIDIHATASVASGKMITYTTSATDIVSGNLPVSCSPASGSTFPIGQTRVNCSATDGAGHTSTGSFDVRVFGCIGCIVPTFDPPRTFALGGDAAHLVAGDFNNDGRVDLVTWGSGTVLVMLGDGSGGFGPSITTNVVGIGSDNSAMATGDFNNDGKSDLALGTQGGVAIIHGDGTGHFGPPDEVGGTQEPWALAVGDFNHDNKPDVATVNQLYGGLSVFLGDGLGVGGGGFSIEDGEPRYNGGAITVGDFNNDGNLDFLFTGGDGSIFVLLGDGSGNFQNVTWIPFDFGVGGPFEIAVADLNGDGKADIATPSVTVHIGDGAGAFSEGVFYPAAAGSRNIRTADINGDGKLDLVTASGGKISVLLGDGNGDFGSLTDFQAGDTSWMALADFNGDGKPDVATLNRSAETISVLLNSTYQTPIGTNSAVVVNNTAFTFDNVTAGGTTSVTPIDPASVGQVPGGFAVSNSVAYEIATTATFTGSVTLAFKVPGPISETDFNSLAILHNVNGTLVDVTASTPARDYANLTIYATTASFSPFYLARKGPHIKTLFDQTKAYKGGNTIPIKLQALNASNNNVSSSSTALFARDLRRLSSNTTAPVVDSGNANPDYTFRYDPTLGGTGGGYIFNLSTKGLASGQYVLSFYVGSDRSFFYTVKFEVK